MTRTLLTGATGTIGAALQPRLAEAGHTVRATSRSPPGDGPADEWVELSLPDGPGLEAALEAVDVVVHAASAPQGDSAAVDARGTEQLLDAAESAGVEHVVYPSIVGVDEIPFSYYEHKLAAEHAIEASAVPATIVRIAQFHEFIDELLRMVGRLPIWPLPTGWQSQPIAVAEAADALVDYVSAEPGGQVPVVGGPEVRTIGELATAYRSARGLHRPILPLPLPGSMAAAFSDGQATCPDRAVGSETWAHWLECQYA